MHSEVVEMAKIFSQFQELIGNTPLFQLKHFEQKYNLKSKLVAKLEYFNPAGSVKDRIAWAMIEDAEKAGLLKKDSVIIEPASGNIAIALAAVAAVKGYRIIITMPETMSIERRKLIKAYGAEIILTDAADGMKGAVLKAYRLNYQIPNSFIPSRFTNEVNPKCHKETTAQEIWNDTDGKIDIFVAGVGTGGTISGVGEFLKDKNSNIKIIAVEPNNSPMLSEKISGKHKIQGIGVGFVPDILNTKIYDEVIRVTDEEAFEITREIVRCEGLLVGISSGAAVAAAKKIAQRSENENKLIVVMLPDTGERYLSTAVFAN